MEDVQYFKHTVGSGLHYITDHLQTFKNGTTQFGDTSEVCVLFTLEQVLSRNNVPLTTNDLWNMAYADDIMSEEDMAYIVYSAIDFTENFDPHSADNIRAVLDDLWKIKCGELAYLVENLLEEMGII